MSVRFPKKVVRWPAPVVKPVEPVVVPEFVTQECERTGETPEEIQEWLDYEADKRGTPVEEIIKEEMDAQQRIKEHPAETSQPDPSWYEEDSE